MPPAGTRGKALAMHLAKFAPEVFTYSYFSDIWGKDRVSCTFVSELI